MNSIYLLVLITNNKIECVYPIAFDNLCDVIQKKYELFNSQIGNWFIVTLKMPNISTREKVKTYTRF